jgi:heat shock protein HslJ
MYRMNVWSVALCLAASCLAACSRTILGPSPDAGQTVGSAPAALTITNTLWKLQSFQPFGSASVPVSNPEQFTMELRADGRMSVRADCNRCSTTYSISGETLAVGPNAACTRAACASAPFDQQYVNALTGATVARVSGGTLECVSPLGILTFAR